VKQQNIVRAYRRYAPVYDLVFGSVLEPGRRQLCSAVHSLAPRTLLEVGVGTGLTLFRYPDTAEIVGVDVSEEMLKHARKRAHDMPHKTIALHSMDGEGMGFPDNTFDCVTVPYVLSVTTDPHKLVAEVRRVCKPGGKILILNHFSGSRFWWLLERSVSSIAEKVGFHASFSFEEHILGHDWSVESVRAVNLFGLSRLVTIRNT
jgi:phosphatidylethanolamine/phosphatidyl-N-methylethanolamine N-methyltransferase